MSEPFSHPSSKALQILVDRLLSHPSDKDFSSLQLWVAWMPPALSFLPPLPPDHLFLGSRRHSPDMVEMLFDTPLTPTELIQFYRDRFEKIQWYEHFPAHQQEERGFVTTAYPGLGMRVHFCRGTQGPSLTVFALKGDNELTQVRLYLNTSQQDSPCAPQETRRSIGWLARNLFPRLIPPLGAQQMEVEIQSMREEATTTATIETEREFHLSDLTDAYAIQLEQAGWRKMQAHRTHQLAWQTWSFEDQEHKTAWQGLFTFVKLLPSHMRWYAYGYIHLQESATQTSFP